MKDDQYSPKPEFQNFNTENQAAQLAVIAGLITTLGDSLSTVAAALALKEVQQANQNNINNSNSDIQTMKEQINDLSIEIQQIKELLLGKGIL